METDKTEKQSLHISWQRFLDPNEQWILVPNGSYGGFFDYVPKHLRLGPWKLVVKVYLVFFYSAIIYLKPDNAAKALTPTYPAPYSKGWWYNVLVFVYMSVILYRILFATRGQALAILTTYTMQSWSYLTLRHGLTAISPWLHQSAESFKMSVFLLHFNEVLRFTSLVTATVTFVLWNFLLGPLIYFYIKTPERRRAFTQFNCSFDMINVHFLNIVFAVLVNVTVSPNRMFRLEDIWFSMAIAAIYSCLYLFVLDRLGVHLYPILSPRSSIAVASVSLLFLMYYGCFIGWNRCMNSGVLLA